MAETQGGRGADHRPVLRHLSLSGPTGRYPGEQDTRTTADISYLDRRGETRPLGGRPSEGQDTTPAGVGEWGVVGEE